MLKRLLKGWSVTAWRVFWVRTAGPQARSAELQTWLEGLAERERESGVRPGDPVFLSPDYRVDPLLTRYVRSRRFRSLAMSTRLNYATDIALLLTFLWSRGKSWRDALDRDLEDFEYWRTLRRIRSGSAGRSGTVSWPRSTAEPIATATMAPLLIWAVRLVEDLAGDILAAAAEASRLAKAAVTNPASRDGRAALERLLEPALTGGPVPAVGNGGKTSVARAYLAGLAGVSLYQVD